MTRKASDIAIDMASTTDAPLDILAPDTFVPHIVDDESGEEEEISEDELVPNAHEDNPDDMVGSSHSADDDGYDDEPPPQPVPASRVRIPLYHTHHREPAPASQESQRGGQSSDDSASIHRLVQQMSSMPTPNDDCWPTRPNEFIDKAYSELRGIGAALEQLIQKTSGRQTHILSHLRISEMQNRMFLAHGNLTDTGFDMSTKSIFMQILTLSATTSLFMGELEHMDVQRSTLPSAVQRETCPQAPIIVSDRFKDQDGKVRRLLVVSDSEQSDAEMRRHQSQSAMQHPRPQKAQNEVRRVQAPSKPQDRPHLPPEKPAQQTMKPPPRPQQYAQPPQSNVGWASFSLFGGSK